MPTVQEVPQRSLSGKILLFRAPAESSAASQMAQRIRRVQQYCELCLFIYASLRLPSSPRQCGHPQMRLTSAASPSRTARSQFQTLPHAPLETKRVVDDPALRIDLHGRAFCRVQAGQAADPSLPGGPFSQKCSTSASSKNDQTGIHGSFSFNFPNYDQGTLSCPPISSDTLLPRRTSRTIFTGADEARRAQRGIRPVRHPPHVLRRARWQRFPIREHESILARHSRLTHRRYAGSPTDSLI